MRNRWNTELALPVYIAATKSETGFQDFKAAMAEALGVPEVDDTKAEQKINALKTFVRNSYMKNEEGKTVERTAEIKVTPENVVELPDLKNPNKVAKKKGKSATLAASLASLINSL